MSKIWLIYPYGGIPSEGLRPDRAQMIVESIKEDEHQITTWISSFDHKRKSQRIIKENFFNVAENISIKIVPTIGYKKNISIKRIFSEIIFGIRLWKISKKIENPDLIILTEPSIFFGFSVLKIIKKSKCKLIIDTQDLWPEIFRVVLPEKIRFLSSIIFKPLYNIRENTFTYANAIISVSDTYKSISLKLAPGLNTDKIKTVYYSVDVKQFRTSMLEKSELDVRMVENYNPNQIRIIFASTLGNNYDVITILKASLKLSKLGINFKLLIAGSGPLEKLINDYLKSNSEIKVEYIGNPNIQDLCAIYRNCHIGLSSYVIDSPVSLPIKAFHYAAAGLAVINSLEGEYADILFQTKSGLNYKSGNVNSLVESILFYYYNPILLNKARLASYELGSQFDFKYQYSKVRFLINSLLEINPIKVN
jgi:glycosyltransferase involved in cell wall biosynthesis